MLETDAVYREHVRPGLLRELGKSPSRVLSFTASWEPSTETTMKAISWLAAASTAITVGAYAQDATVVCGGSDRWAIKTTADTSTTTLAAVAAQRPKTVDDILRQRRPDWSPPKSKYQNQRIAGPEGTTVRLRGWIYRIGHDGNDSDYHLQLVANPNDCQGQSVLVEVPDDRCVVGGNLVPFVRTARNELDVLLGHQPTLHGGEAPPRPTEIIVTGQLFYDLHHEKRDGKPEVRGHGNCKAGTLWELHPVLAVELPAVGVNSSTVSLTTSQRRRRRALGSVNVRAVKHRSSRNAPE